MSTSAVVMSGKEDPKAIGPIYYMPVKIGGVTVDALADTGSQSTNIISSSLQITISSWETPCFCMLSGRRAETI